MWKYMATAAVAAVVLACFSGAQADTFGSGDNQFDIDFVPISGDAGDLGSWPAGSGYTFTGVNRENYRMGTFEITNAQWNKFTAELSVPVTGDPSGAYGVAPYWTGTDVPTNMVSWYEAAQFVNWLNTSTGHQPAYKFTGTQGASDYALDTWSSAEADRGTNLYRHKDAFYFLPTEDEWVKAAYWNGTALQTYANASPGDLVSGVPDPTKWNYHSFDQSHTPWSVGSGAEELNGTYDMMGNVWELMESPHADPNYGTDSFRTRRGSSSQSGGVSHLPSSMRTSDDPINQYGDYGFRVASVPEPSGLALLSLGGLLAARRRR